MAAVWRCRAMRRTQGFGYRFGLFGRKSRAFDQVFDGIGTLTAALQTGFFQVSAAAFGSHLLNFFVFGPPLGIFLPERLDDFIRLIL